MRLNGLFVLLLHYSLCSLISISKAFNSFGMNFFLQSGRPNIGPILALPFPPCKVISDGTIWARSHKFWLPREKGLVYVLT